MAGIYHGHLLEFPLIRVDCFTQTTPILLPPSYRPAPNAQLYLLSHIHTDHLEGLSTASEFNGTILCSAASKKMLLRLEAATQRVLHLKGHIETPRRKYWNALQPRARLRTVDEIRKGKAKRPDVKVDPFHVMDYDVPETFRIGNETVEITMLDANHCPGSSMFLITSPTKAVLHTGDLRADAPFMRYLRGHPVLKPFIRDRGGFFDAGSDGKPVHDGGKRRLDRIYLDTGMLLGTGDMPARSDAIDSLIKAMKLYPQTTRFFIHAWTWGYEQVLERIATAFHSKIHVDRYKAGIIASIRHSEPTLAAIVTPDESSRFHACEAKFRCSTCRSNWRDIVRIEFPEVMIAEFEFRHGKVIEQCRRAKEGKGPWPMTLLCPVARHAPLPELQSLVKLFRPTNLTPNTVIPNLVGADYYVMIGMFRDHLGPGGARSLEKEATDYARRQLATAVGRVPSRFDVEMHVRRVFALQDGEEVNRETTARIFEADFADQLGYGEVDRAGQTGDNGTIKIEDCLDDFGGRQVKRELEDLQRRQLKIAQAREGIMDTLERQRKKHPVEFKVGDDRRSNARLQAEAFASGLATMSDSKGGHRQPQDIDLVTEAMRSQRAYNPAKRRRVTESPVDGAGVTQGQGGDGLGRKLVVGGVDAVAIREAKPSLAGGGTTAGLGIATRLKMDAAIGPSDRKATRPPATNSHKDDEKPVISGGRSLTPSNRSTLKRRRTAGTARLPGKYAVTPSCKAAILKMKTEQTQRATD